MVRGVHPRTPNSNGSALLPRRTDQPTRQEKKAAQVMPKKKKFTVEQVKASQQGGAPMTDENAERLTRKLNELAAQKPERLSADPADAPPEVPEDEDWDLKDL